MTLQAIGILRGAIHAVPAVKYALGVAGLLSVVAIARGLGLAPVQAIAGTIVVLVLMVGLLVFTRLAAFGPRYFKLAALVLMWVSLILVLATASLLFTSTFVGWPRPLDKIINPYPEMDIGTISKEIESQLESRDYPAAWDTLDNVSKQPHSERDVRALLPLQTKVASLWIRDLHVIPPQTFTDVVDKLLPPLNRTAQGQGVEAADALAHIGWGNFLKYREGAVNLAIEAKYRAAVKLDPYNPFAHAMWGHWLIVKENNITEAQRHFAEALKSGREWEFVRNLQLAAFQWNSTEENTVELIRVCNQMRKENVSLPQAARHRLLGNIYFMNREAVLARLDQIIPADEHLLTFQWLTQGMDNSKSIEQRFFFARLLEAKGDCDAAQRLYVLLLGASPTWSNRVREGLDRCRLQSPYPKSVVDMLTALLYDQSAAIRRQAVEGLSAVLADNGRIDMKVFVLVLNDPDSAVRVAATEALVRSGPQAVVPMIELLGSIEPADQVRAAKVLKNIGAESKAAVPALLHRLGDSEERVQEVALEALASIGPDASSAVATISTMLGRRPTLDMRKTLVFTLGKIGPASRPAVPLIIQALQDKSEDRGYLNVIAADALNKIGPGAAPAVPALIEALRSDNVRLPTAATAALGEIGAEAKRAIPALIETMSREEDEHKKNQAEAIGQIAQALANRGDRSSLPVLRTALGAEEGASLSVTLIRPLRDAISFLQTRHP